MAKISWDLSPCPDCRHKVSYHDMYGCTLRVCGGKWGNKPCELSGEFLIEYFNEGFKIEFEINPEKEKS